MNELIGKWAVMMAQAQRFAEAGTAIEAVARAKCVVTESSTARDAMSDPKDRNRVRAVLGDAKSLLAEWEEQLVLEREEARARGKSAAARDIPPGQRPWSPT